MGFSVLTRNGFSAVRYVMWVELNHVDNLPSHLHPRDSVIMNTVLSVHQSWFYVAIATTGIVGLWGLLLAVTVASTTL